MTENPEFEHLCRAEYRNVLRTAYLITGEREQAEDLAQEAFALAYSRWRSLSRLERPGGWLQRTVANLALDWRRRQGLARRRMAAAPAANDASPPPEPPDLELIQALRLLTPRQRTVVVLRYFADESVEDVARAIDRRPGTVRALASQALARLREVLADQIQDREEEVTDGT